MVGRSNSVSLLATVVGLEGGDSDLASDVELVGYGCSSDVEPVAVVGSKILETSSLNVLGPLYFQEVRCGGSTYVWHLDLVALLEMLGESVDEFLGGNVLDGHGTTGVDG